MLLVGVDTVEENDDDGRARADDGGDDIAECTDECDIGVGGCAICGCWLLTARADANKEKGHSGGGSDECGAEGMGAFWTAEWDGEVSGPR